LPRGQRLALVVVEEHAGGALQLADDDTLGAVDDEGPLVGHQGQLAEIDFLTALLPDRLGLGLLVVIEDDEPERDLERNRERHSAVVALLHGVLGLAEVVRVELEQRVVVVVGDRKHRLEERLQSELLTPVGRSVLLQEGFVRSLLNLDQVRDLDDRRDLAEVYAAAAPTLNRACHTLSLIGGGYRPPQSPPQDCGGTTAPRTRPPLPASPWGLTYRNRPARPR